MISNAFLTDFIAEVKKKKEISGLNDDLVINYVKDYLIKEKIDPSIISYHDKKLIVKEIRSGLRLFNARFQVSKKNRGKMLEKNDLRRLLESHYSTKERMPFYPELKKIISELKVKSILDLGCGLNPLALATINIKYTACDINEAELSLINDFYIKENINGKAFYCDLTRADFKSFPSSDLCLILKVFDIIEKKGHKIAEKIINEINCRYFIVSFSTKKLSGKSMNRPKRNWFERILRKNNFNFRIIESNNEIFYLIEK